MSSDQKSDVPASLSDLASSEAVTDQRQRSSSDEAAFETVIDIIDVERKISEVEINEGLVAMVREAKSLGDEGLHDQEASCVVDIDVVVKECDKLEEEKVCRICHLEPDHKLDLSELFQLGCDCKGELGVAHLHCALAWFKLKRDRFCEICGEMAVNVPGIIDHGIMVDWNERRMENDGLRTGASERNRCWRGQQFCNFLLGCFVMAFILPFLFRVHVF